MAKWYEKATRKTGNVLADVVTLGGHSASKRSANAAESAANIQSKAADQGMGLVNDQTQKIIEGNKPYTEAGGYGLSSLMDYVKSGDPFKKPDVQFSDFYKGSDPVYKEPGAFKEYKEGPVFQAQEFDYKSSPGYQQVQAEAMKAAQNSAAAKGSLQSSSTIKNIQKNAGQIAAEDYGNEWNRFQNEQLQKRNQFESDRNFGRGNFESDRTQNNQEKIFGRSNFESDRTQENQKKEFGNMQYRDAYKDVLDNISTKYNSLSSLADLGFNATGRNQQAGQDNMAALVELILGKSNSQSAGVLGKAKARNDLIPDALNRWGTVTQIGSEISGAVNGTKGAK